MEAEGDKDEPLRNVTDRSILVGLHAEKAGDRLVVGDASCPIRPVREEVGNEGVF
jgi:hypothetical protein